MFKDLKNLKKIITSNLALSYSNKKEYAESIKYDEMVIFRLDVNFDKSYIRLIQSHIALKNISRAEAIREIVK